MKRQVPITIKIVLGLIFLTLLIIYSPAPDKTLAQSPTCAPIIITPGAPTPTGALGTIRVQGGFLSATGNLTSDFSTDSNFLCGNQASIPFVYDYEHIISLYYDQVRGSLKKIPLTGNQSQDNASTPINLTTL